MSSTRTVRQVEAIAHGTVIDHIPSAVTIKVAQIIADSKDEVFIGINLTSRKHPEPKGVIKIAGRELSDASLSRLALLAPDATINIIRDYAVANKHKVVVPDFFHHIARCGNPNCITNHQEWHTRFDVYSKSPLTVRCYYCERRFLAAELHVT